MILQGPSSPKRVLGELGELILDPSVERLRVAVAYANPHGVRALQVILDENPVQAEVVVTLDMGITRKAALELLLHEFSGETKVITSTGPGTFHPKIFVVDRGGEAPRALVGSANLTDVALTRNREAISVADLTAEEAALWEAWWADLFASAEDLTQAVIDDYEERRPPPGRRETIADQDEETNADGSTIMHGLSGAADAADRLVIDWGGTGGYREQFEFPRAAGAFFRPDLQHERTVTISHEGHDYTNNQLRYYPDNAMTRLNMDGEMPVVADGSIKTGTSVFTRLGPDHYELHVVDGVERAQLLAEMVSAGGAGETRRHDGSARRFGWA